MITPEFIQEDRGEFVLVASHSVETETALAMSIMFNTARIAYCRQHLPAHLKNCVLIYDLRGQNVSESIRQSLDTAFSGQCELRIML